MRILDDVNVVLIEYRASIVIDLHRRGNGVWNKLSTAKIEHLLTKVNDSINSSSSRGGLERVSLRLWRKGIICHQDDIVVVSSSDKSTSSKGGGSAAQGGSNSSNYSNVSIGGSSNAWSSAGSSGGVNVSSGSTSINISSTSDVSSDYFSTGCRQEMQYFNCFIIL